MLLSCEDVEAMLHFLLDNVFIQVGGKVFQQCVGIPMGTNCAPLSAELLLHDNKSSAMIRFSRTNGHPQAKSFKFTCRYIDDLISVNNPRFDKAIEKIYPSELTLKDTTLADGKVAYLDRQIEIRERQLVMSLYDKRDDFPFTIHNYPHLDSNVPCMPTTLHQSTHSFRQGLQHVSRFFKPSPALSIYANAPGFQVWFALPEIQTVLSFSLWPYQSLLQICHSTLTRGRR